MTGSVDEWRTMNGVYIDYNKGFAMVSYSILIAKLVSYSLDKWTIE